MHHPGRGRRRLTAVSFAIALAAGVLAPAASADYLSFSTGVSDIPYVYLEPGQTADLNATVSLIPRASDGYVRAGTSFDVVPSPSNTPGATAATGSMNVFAVWPDRENVNRPRTNLTVGLRAGSALGVATYDVAWRPSGEQCAADPPCVAATAPTRYSVNVIPRPAGVPSIALDGSQADMSWTPSPDDGQITAYTVTRYKKSKPGDYRQWDGLAPGTTAVHDQGLEPGVEYCWRIGEYFRNPLTNVTSTGRGAERCATTNALPTAPGPVTGPEFDADGRFSVGWSPSADADGDPFTYELERQDARGGGWVPVASGLTGTSTEVTVPEEGTWSFRVRAVSSVPGHASGWNSAGAPVKYDRFGPSQPRASAGPGTPQNGWYGDSVTVSWDGSVDPTLPDGSPGTGVASYTGSTTLTEHGEQIVAGRAVDRAGNAGPPITTLVRVDTKAPTVSMDCPTRPVVKGSSYAVRYTAADEGSGLTSNPIGDVRLDTSTAGRHTATTPRIEDFTGHVAEPASCDYVVHEAPTKPGLPAGPDVDPDGRFDVKWDPSSDDDGPVRYSVAYADARGSYALAPSGLVDEPSYSADLPDGTYTFAVRSLDTWGAGSDYAIGTATTKVDRVAPTAPVASTEPAEPAYDGWFTDRATISFDGAADPRLPDGSPGSGAISYPPPQSFDTEGEHTATGSATDAAGNVSPSVARTVKVDTAAPDVGIECPTDPVPLGSTQAAGWSATDSGSGVAGDSSGTVSLSTSTRGSHTVSAPVVEDRVGHRSAEVSCRYDVNAPPSAPGAPGGPALTRDGSFDVHWAAASDPDGDRLAYVVQQRDADDSDWSPAGAGDDHLQNAVHVGDGTWRFRVKAVDGRGGESDWVESAQASKVDSVAPSDPSAATDPASPTGGWFGDSVTVTWTGSSDPALPDGSPGSGGLTYSAGRTFATEGANSAGGTATDAAGNESRPGATSVKVDRTPPAARIACPSDRIVAGTPAAATWTASDGESGLATAASGSVDLDTRTPGSRTAAAPVARDVVGHRSPAAECAYVVVAPNSAPGDPGAPTGPSSDRDGRFTLAWRASDDPDAGDRTTYALQARDADDTAWTDIASGLTEPRADAALADGTWSFRVRGTDSHGASSAWVGSTAPTKVDGGRPSAPQATTTPAVPASGDWFKDAVAVSFAGSTDPVLADGSAGSGVDSYTSPRTVDTSGAQSVTGTATDRAGNDSAATSRTVKVDATAPATRITCPDDDLIVGQTGASAAWTASDGESGLATAASGSVALNTASAGVKTVAAPAARDKVGHTGTGASCEYQVRYRFSGGVAPVEGSNVINVGRRGRTYPVRWRLTRWNGAAISDSEGVALARQMSAADSKVTCSSFLSAGEDDLEEETGVPSPSLRYDTSRDWFVYSYRAPAAGCYTLDLYRADGVNAKRWRFLFVP